MKCPKCMEKCILDDVPVVNICPECGSEMELCIYPYDYYHCLNPKCGHSEKVKP